MSTPPSRAFTALRWMRRPKGPVARALLAGAGFAAGLMVSGRARLARPVARAMWQGDVKLGAHRLHWLMAHGWTARRIAPPLFDPTTGLEAGDLDALEDFLGASQRHRLARLYVLARRLPGAADPDAVLDRFEAVASTLIPALPAPNPEAQGSKGATFTLDHATEALRALKALPQPWYVISGTFLGAVREGTFLAHDYDIDIGIHAEDFDETAFLETVSGHPDLVFVNHSAHLDLVRDGAVWQAMTRPALYRLLHRSGLGIDVFIHHRDGDIRWHGSAKHRWDNSEFELAEYTLAGTPVRGPADADRYLTENYGTWRVPVTRFNCSTGTPNVSFPRNLSAVAEHLRVAILGRDADAEIARLVLTQEGYVAEGRFRVPWRDGASR